MPLDMEMAIRPTTSRVQALAQPISISLYAPSGMEEEEGGPTR